jgi:hypothetical protein
VTRPPFVILLTIFVNLIGFGIIIPGLPFYAQIQGAASAVESLGRTLGPVWGTRFSCRQLTAVAVLEGARGKKTVKAAPLPGSLATLT